MKPAERIKEVFDNTSLQWMPLGDVFLECGGVTICDPLAGVTYADRVQRSVPEGTYPVSVLKGEIDTVPNRYCYAQIQFSNEPVKKVILARLVLSNTFFVDAGLACFMDTLTWHLYNDF